MTKATGSSKYKYELLHNIIEQIHFPTLSTSLRGNDNEVSESSSESYLTRGDFYYYHYGCDGQQDQNWGCGYRTLQTMISWILNKRCNNDLNIPTLRKIQETLVGIGDKPKSFVGSCEWIGALEVFYVVDSLYDVSCKIVHITRNEKLTDYVDTLISYFNDYGGFVMMGGDMDAASKGIAGVYTTAKETYLLVVDPHYSGVPASIHNLIEMGFIRWQNVKEFVDSSFYNLCLPYLK